MSWWDDNGFSNVQVSKGGETPNYFPNQNTGITGLGGQTLPGGVVQVGAGGTSNTPTQSPQDFIRAWQQSHPTPDINALLEAMKAAGYTNVDHYYYGTTPSGNELSIGGVKYKVISGENSGSPSWYTAGTEDSGGAAPGLNNGSLADFTQQFNAPSPYAPTPFNAPTIQDVQNQPGYQIGLQSGQQAIQNSAAAHGTYFTPNTLEGLSKFSTDYAGTQYGNALNQAESLYGLTEGAKKSAYDTNYQNAWNQYLAQFNIANTNRQNTFGELFNYAQLGQQAASAGG